MKQAILLTKTEQTLRLNKLRAKLMQKNTDALLVTAPANLFYTTGRICNGYFYLPAEGEPRCFLRHDEAEDARTVRKPEQIPALLAEMHIPAPRRLALETGEISAAEYRRLAAAFATAEITDATSMLREARSVKTPFELEQLRAAGRTHGAIYDLIPNLYQKGMNDLEFSVAIEREVRLAGSIGYFRTFGFRMEGFMGCVLAGANCAVPSPYDFSLGGAGLSPAFPGGPCGHILLDGETVLVDINYNPHGYMTDLSRTFCLGEPNKKTRDAYETSRAIERAVAEQLRPGVRCADLYRLALDMAADSGLSDCFMGSVRQAAFIGHGLGIEINELPVLMGRGDAQLEAGMVVALEPKFVTMTGPAGVEDTYIVTANGGEQITICSDELRPLSV